MLLGVCVGWVVSSVIREQIACEFEEMKLRLLLLLLSSYLWYFQRTRTAMFEVA